ncbi:hypothetical protein L202_01980 [Cryptococcus amylolentus CBS 6039]|uniref:Uncharacterized protein n=1 Tax=Cryptococcus amylolentus CBS 6039 TaxID=1295533 RepID=A0A1E3HZE4_9TREE|nr:hypothetical protein L202_01980 [Cryptococcus amylolentus CBS 6039]ODN81565.1 hypothetical protein L202_01980 [Cryptococcus amylolentus CBS 6039]
MVGTTITSSVYTTVYTPCRCLSIQKKIGNLLSSPLRILRGDDRRCQSSNLIPQGCSRISVAPYPTSFPCPTSARPSPSPSGPSSALPPTNSPSASSSLSSTFLCSPSGMNPVISGAGKHISSTTIHDNCRPRVHAGDCVEMEYTQLFGFHHVGSMFAEAGRQWRYVGGRCR